MANMMIKDLNEDKELDKKTMTAIRGGRINLSFLYPKSPFSSKVLASPDGSPVAVYLDGVSINDPTTGYYHV